MSVLIAYASARPSTAVIAERIADRLVKAGFVALVHPLDQVESIRPSQPVIIGSDVRDHEWLPDACRFLQRFSRELARSPVWLFSTGAHAEVGSFGPKIAALVHDASDQSAAVSSARDMIRVRDHRYFGGAFERGSWRSLGDMFLRICGGSPPDPRDWRDVNAWTAGIARELQHIDHLKERRRLHLSVRGRP